MPHGRIGNRRQLHAQSEIREIGEGQHNVDAHHKRDKLRDARLNGEDFRVLRFWNNEVDSNLTGVLDTINAALREEPHPAGFAGHPPPLGEG